MKKWLRAVIGCAANAMMTARRECEERRFIMTRIERSIEVNVPVSTAYNQLTQFEQYPRFMEDVEEVRQLDDTHLHWHTKAGNLDMEWDAEITQQVPDRCIAWRNTSGPRYEGKIELRSTQEDRTEVRLTMECDPKQQVLAQHGDAATAITQRTEHDLERFKKFIEKLGRETGGWRGKVKDAEPLATDAGEQQTGGETIGKAVGQTASERREATDSQQQTGQANEPQPQAERSAGAQTAQPIENWPALDASWLPKLMQAWDEPLNIMRRMSEDMDRMLERFIGGPLAGARLLQAANGSSWTPPIEIAQRNGEFVVCAELAGVRREDLSVEVRDDRLTIEGERRPQHASDENRQSERAYGRFYRVVSLPQGADTNAASASLHDGMLEVTVPVSNGGRQGRRIEIQSPRQ
jgi:HSP20 family molecular chaperone IbpA/uncharacterized membrane protein